MKKHGPDSTGKRVNAKIASAKETRISGLPGNLPNVASKQLRGSAEEVLSNAESRMSLRHAKKR